jgi:outer membrane protein OmpA-like peptidoglycan-associated protein
MKSFKKAFVLLLLAQSAWAINLQGYKFSEAYRYSFLEDSGLENFNSPILLTTSLSHIAVPLFITDSTSSVYRTDVIKNYNLLTLGAGFQLTDFFNLGLETSLLKTKLQNDSEFNIGETLIRSRLNLMKNKDSSLSFNPFLTLPTGKTASYTTGKNIGLGLRAVYEKSLEAYHLLAGVGFSHNDKNVYDIINYRNLALLELGLSYDLNQSWNVNLEVNRNFTLATDTHQDEGDYYLTIKNKTIENVNSYAGIGLAGFNDRDKRNWTLFAGLKLDLGPNRPLQKPVVTESIKKPVLPPLEKKEEKAKPLPTPPVVIKTAKDEKKLGPVFKIENIYFENNKIKILDTEKIKIDELTASLRKDEKSVKHIVIEGFASKVGNSKKNQALSLKRALEVQNKLIDQGIPKEMTSIVAYGDTAKVQFKDVNKNRRVQFRVYINKAL